MFEYKKGKVSTHIKHEIPELKKCHFLANSSDFSKLVGISQLAITPTTKHTCLNGSFSYFQLESTSFG